MKRYTILALACVFGLVLGAGRGDEPDVDDLVRQANRLARDKKYDEALDAIHKAIKMEPTNDRWLMIASEINRRAGRFADGKRDALAAIRVYREHGNDGAPGVYYALVAGNAYHNEEPELALEYCRKVIDMGPKTAGTSIYKDAKLYEDLLLKKTYTITWKLDPSDPQHRKYIRTYLPVAVPKDGLPYQSVSVQVKDAKSYRILKGDANDVVNVVPNGDKPFEVVTKVTLTPISYKAKLAKPLETRSNGSLPASVRTFLGKADTIDPNSTVLKKATAQVKGANSVETVRNVLAWLKKNIAYKQETTDITKLNFKSVDEIVERGHAECRGYTMLFAALCRAAGVPARPVWGVLFADNAYRSHNWDEVYIAGVGWVPVDPQWPETFGWLPINHVRVFMDLRQSDKSEENLPLLNLLFMNGEKLQYEQSR